ncbi:malto-oligosyltrehalose trehalohydrolase [Oxalicibacterium faecigallinarum]|uniref:Malto-oligosyltrehalose trehalohydrolase n=1 Tax=Oxalicibacterium faecigallinarum TaxID=573741 RepID=A0A8J3AT41_9BURK|nr:malto-oligosyltrehalose trehalohydrolase [Oxalicibacterium faecigallinarum]GGI20966.1 malto-oligosyltrehalose trehalohydrolase [Oxalicibacterium faecigallinarum]
MSSFNYAFGAQIGSAGRVLFRLWAPSADQVNLILGGDTTHAMTALPDGWFALEVACQPGSRYQYEIVRNDGSTMRVADPASRAQDTDVHDASVVVDLQSYHWQYPLWRGRPWHETVLYELHVGACGGFSGVTHQLPALAALGITAIELMPINDFPGTRNWGYDGVLPYAPDTSYGTPEELKALIDTAHGLGMMVFLDVVYNHFGPDGNYLGAYAKDFFRDDIQTPWGQAIDFRRPQVRNFFTENALYWLREYRFDGLRFDAVHMISEQDWLEEMGQRIRDEMGHERHIHLVLEHDDNAAHLLGKTTEAPFDAQWNDDGHHVLHTLLTGENDHYYLDYCQRPAEKLARCLAEGFVYQGEPSPIRDNALRGESSAHLPPTAFVLFIQNHDQIGNRAFGDRLTTLARPDALRAAMALLLLSPQIPLLFMGEQWGSTTPFLFFTSYQDEGLATAVRDGRRQEFAGFAAFADEAQRERIPDPNAPDTFSDSIPQQGPDAEQWQTWVHTLLALRKQHVMPHLHDCRSLGAQVLGESAVVARWQLAHGRVLTVALNLASIPIKVTPDNIVHTGGADLLFETTNVMTSLQGDILPADSFIALLEPVA